MPFGDESKSRSRHYAVDVMSRRPPIALASLVLVAMGCAGQPGLRGASSGVSSPPSGSLHVEVVASSASAGTFDREASLRTALFAEPREWPSGRPDFRVRSPFVDGRGTAVFESLPPGRYAVVVFVDLDGDEELDRGAFGVPTEPIAYGNDAKPRFGPPPFEACLVEVGGDRTEVVLTLVVE